MHDIGGVVQLTSLELGSFGLKNKERLGKRRPAQFHPTFLAAHPSAVQHLFLCRRKVPNQTLSYHPTTHRKLLDTILFIHRHLECNQHDKIKSSRHRLAACREIAFARKPTSLHRQRMRFTYELHNSAREHLSENISRR